MLGLNTYTFFMRKGGQGGPFFQCASEGSAVPNTAELTNPQQYVSNADDPSLPSDGVAVIGNMDPDGVFPPAASQGTYVRCLYDNGKPYLVYSEPDVIQLNASNASWDPSACTAGKAGSQCPTRRSTASRSARSAPSTSPPTAELASLRPPPSHHRYR